MSSSSFTPESSVDLPVGQLAVLGNRIRDVTMAHLLIPKISKVRKCCDDQLNSPGVNRTLTISTADFRV